MKSLYELRGVSAQKEEVHLAIRNIQQGLYPNAFCKLYPDYLGNDEDFVCVSHADGAGTKTVLAYLTWKETGDLAVWKGIAQDAIAMNLDDLLCVGIYDNLLFSSTIDRNKHLVSGDVLTTLIEGNQAFFDKMMGLGINIHYLGGETADVGDVVRTISVNGTMTARWPKKKLITNEKITNGDLIVGFSSSGKSVYEDRYNSGIGSNGLTSARHDVLSYRYRQTYPESCEPNLLDTIAYIGKYSLGDKVFVEDIGQIAVSDLLLSPTRTYAPLLVHILKDQFQDIHGIVHCSGGGQTKCMKYLPKNFRIVKDNLFEAPAVFQLIQNSSGSDYREMYQVFNMGHRLEIFTNGQDAADRMIETSAAFGIEAKIIGRVLGSDTKELVLEGSFGQIVY